MIAAMARGRVIGANGSLPWRLPADMRHFVRTTRGKPVIMGRRNYEDIGGPLPKRQNIVVTRRAGYVAPGCRVVDHPDAAIEAAGEAEEPMIIGGQQIYEAFLPLSQRLYLTYIDATIDGDTFFPEIEPTDWRTVDSWSHPADGDNPHAMAFVTLERTSSR
jgi:dihydrofolate reductase